MNRAAARTILFGLTLALACRAQGIQPDASLQESPTSTDLLAKVSETYRNLESYQDEGVAITKFERTTGGHTIERHFKTAYRKAGQFRFEFSESDPVQRENRYVVWSLGKEAKSWWTVRPGVERHESLGGAIAGATGVSGGTAYTIPSILIKEAAWKGSTWTAATGTYRISDGVESNKACFRVQRMTATNARTDRGLETPATRGKATYWISMGEGLLLRIDRETDFGSFQAKETVRYVPVTNSQIPEEAFAFGH